MSSFKIGISLDIRELKEGAIAGLEILKNFAEQGDKLLKGVSANIDVKSFEKTLKKLNKKINDFESEDIETNIELKDKASNVIENITKKAQESIEKNKSAYAKMTNEIATFGFAAQGVVTMIKGIATAIEGAVTPFKEFEEGMANVNTLLNVGQDELEVYGDKVLEISRETGKSAVDLTNSLYQAVSAGMNIGDALQMVKIGAKAGIAGLSDTETAVDGVTTVLNAFHMEAGRAEEIADYMFNTVKRGKTTFGEIASSISDVAPIAAASGVGFEQVSAAIATLTKQGIPNAQATTMIRASIMSMNEVLGDGWSKTMSLQKGMQAMTEKAGGSNSKLRELAGRVEAVTGILAMTGENAQMAAEDLEAMGDSGGAMMDAYAVKAETLDSVINRLSTAWNALSVEAMRNFAPALSKVLEMTTSLLNVFKTIPTNADNVRRSFLQQRGEFEANVTTLKELRDKQKKSKAELKQYKQIVGELQSQYGSYLSNIDLEKDGWDKVSGALDKVRESIVEKRKEELRAAEQKDLIDSIAKAELEEEKLLKKIKKERAKANAELEEAGLLGKEILSPLSEEAKQYGIITGELSQQEGLLQANKKLQAKLLAQAKEQGLELGKNTKKTENSGKSGGGDSGKGAVEQEKASIAEIARIRKEYNLAMLESDYQRQIKSLEYEKQANLEKVDALKISEDEKWKAKLMLEQTYDKKIEAVRKEHTKKLLDEEKKGAEQTKELTKQVAEGIARSMGVAEAEVGKAAEAMVSAMSYIAGQINSIISMMSQQLQAEKQAEVDAVELRAEKEGKSEEWLATEKEKINAKYAKKEKQLAKAKKAMAITDATINTAVAAAAALKAGPILGPILSGIIIGLGAVQIALIAKQKYAKGGAVGSAGSGIQADETGEKPAGIVHEGEYVFERPLVEKYGSFLASLILKFPILKLGPYNLTRQNADGRFAGFRIGWYRERCYPSACGGGYDGCWWR